MLRPENWLYSVTRGRSLALREVYTVSQPRSPTQYSYKHSAVSKEEAGNSHPINIILNEVIIILAASRNGGRYCWFNCCRSDELL